MKAKNQIMKSLKKERKIVGKELPLEQSEMHTAGNEIMS